MCRQSSFSDCSSSWWYLRYSSGLKPSESPLKQKVLLVTSVWQEGYVQSQTDPKEPEQICGKIHAISLEDPA